MSTRIFSHALGGALVLTLCGCAALAPTPEGKLYEREGVSMVVIPGNSRETYFSDPSSRERHCRAPSPDFSVTSSEGVSVTAMKEGVSEDAATGALSLGGRNPSVLIARELLYRACETSNNLNLSTDATLKLFRDVMNVVVKISTTQTGAGAAALGASAGDTRTQAPVPGASSGTGSTGSNSSSSTSSTGSTSGW